MNPYVIPCTCEVCGCDAMCRPRDAAASWFGGGVRHRDPEVCAANLKYRADQIKRREQELAVAAS